MALAEDIIDKMSGEFEPGRFEDRYENAMIELSRRQSGAHKGTVPRSVGNWAVCASLRLPSGLAAS